jgi:phage tail sheath gpL-like
MTFTENVGVVTGTARNDGLLGNNIAISYNQGDITGTTYVVVQPTGGAVDPDITNCLTAIFPEKYNKIFCSLNDATNLALLKQHLIDVSAATEKRRAVGVFGYTGVQATLETLAGTTLNSGRMSVGYVKYTKTTEHGHSLDYEIGAAYSSVLASEQDPAKPLNQLPLVGIAPASVENNYSYTQEQSLLFNGVTPLKTQPGAQVGISRAITTYTTNATGTADPSQLDLTTITTADFYALAVETNQQLTFGRAKASNGIEDRIRTVNIQTAKALESLEILRNVDKNLDGFIVEEDTVNFGQYNSILPGPVVPGLHVMANRVDVIL